MPVHSTTNITVVLLLLASAVSGDDSSPVRKLRLEFADEARSRTVPVKVDIRGKRFPQPVVLFSHKLGGSRDNQ